MHAHTHIQGFCFLKMPFWKHTQSPNLSLHTPIYSRSRIPKGAVVKAVDTLLLKASKSGKFARTSFSLSSTQKSSKHQKCLCKAHILVQNGSPEIQRATALNLWQGPELKCKAKFVKCLDRFQKLDLLHSMEKLGLAKLLVSRLGNQINHIVVLVSAKHHCPPRSAQIELTICTL